MKAILVGEFGGPEVLKLKQVPTLQPAAGQVLVRIHAAGVNPYDTYMRAGAYARKPPLPYTPVGWCWCCRGGWRRRKKGKTGRPCIHHAHSYGCICRIRACARAANTSPAGKN